MIDNYWHDLGVMLQIKTRFIKAKVYDVLADAAEDVTRSFRSEIGILKKLSFEDDFIGPLLEYAEAIV